MEKDVAERLVAAIKGYPAGRLIQPRMIAQDGGWTVVSTRGSWRRVPERLELTDNPCRCDLPACASGKVAPSLLNRVRAGSAA